MDKQTLRTQYRVSDFVAWQRDDALELNPFFQRRPVWKKGAKSYLVDTIIRELPMATQDDEYSPEMAAQRRDRVLRAMVNTPPRPNGKTKPHHQRKRSKAGADRRRSKKHRVAKEA